MSWLFSRALVEEYLGENFSDGALFALLKSTPTEPAYCSHGNATVYSLLSPYGMTCARLTAIHGEELLTWYRAGFPVRTYPQPEKAQESQENAAACGNNLPASLAKFNRNTSSWKIPPSSPSEAWESFSGIWPRWGMMLGGECWAQLTPKRRTSGKESGSWPTPRSCSAMGASITPETCHDPKRNPNLETVLGRMMWPTPTPTSSEVRKIPATANYGQIGLNNHPRIRGNPTRPNQKTGSMEFRGGTKTRRTWPTPTAMEGADCGSKWEALKKLDKGGRIQRRMATQEITESQETERAQLNPSWVEWLMGWPIGWTDLQPLAMDRFQQWLYSHGKRCVPEAPLDPSAAPATLSP